MDRGAAPRGFTMVELLVSIGATVLLALFMQQVFSSLSAATAAGKGNSAILENARIIPTQLLDDADPAHMIGPSDNGVLIIINHLTQLSPLSESSPTTAQYRADQVMWLRAVTDEYPRTPTNVSSYTSQIQAPVARVWYGHLLQTTPDGLCPTGRLLGDPNTPSEFAANWILGRQLLFLFDSPTFNTGSSIHSRGGWVDAPVFGYGSAANASPYLNNSAYPPDPPTPGHNGPLYMGLTDRAFFGHTNDANHPTIPTVNSGSMVGGSEPSPDTPPNQGRKLYSDLPSSEYLQRALEFTYSKERLRVNPTPTNPSPVSSNDGAYECWQIAQSHPFLADHVVDFQVQFAGDYSPANGEIDRNTAGDNEIVWYDFSHDTRYPGASALATIFAAPSGSEPIYSNPVPGFPHADAAFIFRHGGGPAATNWPYFLRFRYRLIDPKGRTVGPDGEPGKIFETIVPVTRN